MMHPFLKPVVTRLIAMGRHDLLPGVRVIADLNVLPPLQTSEDNADSSSSKISTNTQPPLMDVAEEVGLDFHHHNGMDGSLYYSEMMGGGVALFDYDRDGDLDVYLTQGHDLRPGEEGSPIGHLYRNELLTPSQEGPGELRFTDVTAEAGLADVPGYGMGVVVLDLESDGWPDLYVTQTGPNRLLRNRGDGTFVEIGGDAGVDLDTWSVPAVAIDVDGDGWQDLFVGDYVDYSLATNKRCTDELGQANYCGPLAYPPMADRLLRNRGDGTFGRHQPVRGHRPIKRPHPRRLERRLRRRRPPRFLRRQRRHRQSPLASGCGRPFCRTGGGRGRRRQRPRHAGGQHGRRRR